MPAAADFDLPSWSQVRLTGAPIERMIYAGCKALCKHFFHA
jgi:hypothetical protein